MSTRKELKELKEICKEDKLTCPPILPINFLVGNTAPQEGVVKIVNGTESNRMFRNGINTTCDSKKTCPGPFPAVVPYTTLTFENPGRKEACVTITVQNLSSSDVFSHAHVKRYDPNNICKYYLGDAGLSTSTGTRSYQIVLPKGTKKFAVVVEGVAPNTLPSFGLLTVSGLPCQSTTTTTTTTVTAPLTVAKISAPVPGVDNDLKK